MQDFFDAIKDLAGGEVYALVAAENTQYPAIVYTPIVQEHIFGIDGPHDLHAHALQVDTYARTYQEALHLQDQVLAALLADCRTERSGREGRMAIGALEQGIVARYLGASSQAARHWFTRIWRRTRIERGLAAPELPRVWPFQEQPFAGPAAADGAVPTGSP